MNKFYFIGSLIALLLAGTVTIAGMFKGDLLMFAIGLVATLLVGFSTLIKTPN